MSWCNGMGGLRCVRGGSGFVLRAGMCGLEIKFVCMYVHVHTVSRVTMYVCIYARMHVFI